MKPYRIAMAIMIVAALLVPAVAAQETRSHNYTVTPAGDTVLEGSPVFTLRNAGSITQGETDWYSTYVAPGTKELIIDLNWGDSSDSLRLAVYAPNALIGPYYDSYGGTVDGRICLRISDSVGLYPGTWRFEVYGYDVTGTEDYTFGWQ